MEAKIFTIGQVTFKQTACSHYFVKQGEKFVKVSRSEYDIAVKQAAENVTPENCLVKLIGTIAKPIARKLTRRYTKGKKSAVKWFNDCESVTGFSHDEIKRHLKKVA